MHCVGMVDWDDGILPQSIRDSEPVRGDVVPLGHDNAVVAIHTRAAPSVAGKFMSKWIRRLPAPQHMNRDEQFLAAARMRAHKSGTLAIANKALTKDAVNGVLTRLRNAGLLRDKGRSRASVLSSGVLKLYVPEQKQLSFIPWSVMLNCAFSSLVRRNDCAKAFEMKDETVGQIRTLVSAVIGKADDAIMTDMQGDWKKDGSLCFVSFFSADATKEPFQMEIEGLPHGSQIARGPWHVMVSNQRFSWLAPSEAWHTFEPRRPPVPMVSSETAVQF